MPLEEFQIEPGMLDMGGFMKVLKDWPNRAKNKKGHINIVIVAEGEVPLCRM